jgi:DNA-binding beta-propeller fold protein YncE
MSWGEPGTDPGHFNLPHNLVTDRDGLVYVADRENHRVQIFDGRGHYQGQWNNLHRPCGLFIDRTQNGGTFYVGELGHALPVNEAVANLGPRVTVLDAKGEKVARFGGQFAGEKPGEFIAPHSVVTDSRGDVYVSEVSWTQRGQHEKPPREVRSLQKFARVA